MNAPYIYGYDIWKRLWIVGRSTKNGTISKVEFDFADAEDAKRKTKELNEKESQPIQIH